MQRARVQPIEPMLSSDPGGFGELAASTVRPPFQGPRAMQRDTIVSAGKSV